jgi:UDP-N-acetylmuramoyl-tripeptide--D-alanyl-D-alanine ligase
MAIEHERQSSRNDVSGRMRSELKISPLFSFLKGSKGKLPSPLQAAAARIARALVILYRIGPLRRVKFIGVTGSTGKTTTKELIYAILSSRFPGHKSQANDNLAVHETILQVRPRHKFCVQEIAAATGGRRVPLERPLALLRPCIGVVTNIGTDHLKAFGSIEGIAREKGKLVAALPKAGAAILNADDPRVLAMQSACQGRVVTYGLSPDAMLRAENISCVWPDRLSFDLLHDGRRHTVQTQLCGVHWVPCVLAAIGAALEMGMTLADATHAVGTFPPTDRRMEPVIRPDGVTFIRDDFKGPVGSIGPALDFMQAAKASRKIVVIGTISDYAGNSETVYKRIARLALETVDVVIFVGPKSSKCAKVNRDPRGDALWLFPSVEQACEYLAGVLQPGDLVLLKGGNDADHLERLCSIRTSQLPVQMRENNDFLGTWEPPLPTSSMWVVPQNFVRTRGMERSSMPRVRRQGF